jgi:CRP-like cAMP-binding protein
MKTTIQLQLATMPLFASLSDEGRERLACGAQFKYLQRDAVLFRAGEPCNEFYVVILGQLKLCVLNAKGQEKIIWLVSNGQSFAEAHLFTNKHFIFNAQALSDTLLLRVDKQAVLHSIEHDPRFGMLMLAGVARHWLGLVQDVESYALHSGTQRVINYLLHELEEASTYSFDAGTPERRNAGTPERRNAGMVSLAVSKASVASRLSLTPEYFSRVIHELVAKGLIALDGCNIFIGDVARLSSYGSPEIRTRAKNVSLYESA